MNQEDRTQSEVKNAAGVTRRRLLQQAGCVIAAAAVSPVVAGAAAQTAPAAPVAAKPAAGAAMDRLSIYMSDAHGRALPDEVVEKAKQHILDTFAAMISGAELPPGQVALRVRPLASRRGGGHRRRLRSRLRSAGGGNGERHARPLRRDR